MSNSSKHTSMTNMLELRGRINLRFKAALAEEQHAYDLMLDQSDEQLTERSRIDYLLALGKQEAFESIMTLIDNFSYGSA